MPAPPVSTALIGIAAILIAVDIERYRWIACIGLPAIVYIAGETIRDGWHHPDVGMAKLG